MRILHIASGDFFSTYGGGQVYVKNIVDEMIRQGVDVAVVSVIGGNEGVTLKNYNGIPLYEISSSDNMKQAIEQSKPDVIHAHSLKDVACRIGEKCGIPVVVTSHHGGILCPAGTRLNCKDEICHKQVNHRDCLPCVLRNIRSGKYWFPVMRYIPEGAYVKFGQCLKKLPFIPFITPIGAAALSVKAKHEQWHTIASSCTAMIAPCYEIANAMVENGLLTDKVRVVPHGIPLPKERPGYPPVVDGKVKFFYVGRICYVKGIHILLKAFTSVDNPDIELHLIGGAGNKQEQRYMNRLKKCYASDKRVIWHGKIAPEAVFEATRNYHVSSSSSFLEAFGLNIAEALALGKPVLATRSGGGEMQIRDGENGWLVPTNDVPTLANKIAYIASHPEILPVMSANCHAVGITEHCKSLMQVYNDLPMDRFK